MDKKERLNELASQVDVIGQNVGFNKFTILNTITKDVVQVPLNVTEKSPLTRKDIISNMILNFLNEQFVSQKLIPCTFYEILSFSSDIHMLSIYETKEDSIYEMPPAYQFIFNHFKDEEIVDGLGLIVSKHFIHVTKHGGDPS